MKAFFIVLLAALATSAAQAQGPTGMKAGLWETRTTAMSLDGKNMLPQMLAAREEMRKSLASLPPEQRKKMAAMLPPEGGDPLSQRMCISPAMAARDQTMVPRPKGAECDPPKLNRSGNRTTFEFACKQGGGKTSGKGETVVAGDLVTTKVETTGTDASGAKHTMRAETQMKYLGSDCGQVKPIEQLAKEAGATAPRGAPARK